MTKEQFRTALAGCGCTLRDGNVYYEEDDLIECLEDMKLFDSVELEPCEDCISRKAIIEKAYEEQEGMDAPYKDFGVMVDWLASKMPPVTPARKKGKWITIHEDEEDEPAAGFFRCSCCKDELYDITKYCPSCGSYNGG